ncbi:hypothetical protein FA15DRAFT_753402 [Coprinopsis marcescibilis]|uniref:F-box domain-containing protein n=1 Tax=Coprinopsis marcescibilis TaxID=230819 RepID=A0A5C3L6X1_COPMA|nr:hypothetical protein FA15DRAFT_753402 [Coprinopsis marcescibilis]
MESSPTIPAEILDIILISLREDRHTLAVASTVCRRFGHLCQKLLFSRYRLADRGTRSSAAGDIQGHYHVPAHRRLLKTLESSPHLGPYVMSLSIGKIFDSQGRAIMSHDFRRALALTYPRLPNLRRLEINAPKRGYDWDDLPLRVPVGQTNLVSAITHLTLRNIHDVPIGFSKIFPGLEELCLEQVSFVGNEWVMDIQDQVEPTISLMHLRLAIDHLFVPWIFSVSSGISVQNLEELSIRNNFQSSIVLNFIFVQIMQEKNKSLWGTLESLELSDVGLGQSHPQMNVPETEVDLSKLTKLRNFRINASRLLSDTIPGSAERRIQWLTGWLEGLKACKHLQYFVCCFAELELMEDRPYTIFKTDHAPVLEEFLLEFQESLQICIKISVPERHKTHRENVFIEKYADMFPRLRLLDRFEINICYSTDFAFPSYYET